MVYLPVAEGRIKFNGALNSGRTCGAAATFTRRHLCARKWFLARQPDNSDNSGLIEPRASTVKAATDRQLPGSSHRRRRDHPAPVR